MKHIFVYIELMHCLFEPGNSMVGDRVTAAGHRPWYWSISSTGEISRAIYSTWCGSAPVVVPSLTPHGGKCQPYKAIKYRNQIILIAQFCLKYDWMIVGNQNENDKHNYFIYNPYNFIPHNNSKIYHCIRSSSLYETTPSRMCKYWILQ